MEIARRIGEPVQIGVSLNWMGNWYTNEDDPNLAMQHHQEALHIFEGLGNPRDLANTLDLLGLAHLFTGDISASLPYFNRSIDLYRQLDDRPRLASSLLGRANTVSALVYLASAAAIPSAKAVDDYREALSIAEQIDLASEKAWGYYSLGILHIMHGHFGRAQTVLNKGLRIATEIKHREMLIGNRFARGILLIELFALDQAKEELESTLVLAEGLNSQIWIHFVRGALAELYLMLSEHKAAEACLNKVISSNSPMNTLGRRYCWARKAELALIQDDPTLSLDITNRLIASAPGMSHQRVIPYLWKMKGKALAANGDKENARLHFQEAIESAEETGEKFLIWRIRQDLGLLLQSMGHDEAAEKELVLAQRNVHQLAASINEETLKEKFYQGANEILKVGILR
jgi:tetratricopeptide (TPR) repeat protein